MMPSPWRWLVLVMALALAAAIYFGARLYFDSKTFICNTAELISYVPAGQFPEETKEDFLGWTATRQVLLSDALRVGCDAEIIAKLEARIELDQQLIEERSD